MGWLLASLFAFITFGNFALIYRSYVYKRQASLVPLLGGISGSLACYLLPFPRLQDWLLIPLLLDPGAVPIIAFAFALFASRRLRSFINTQN